MAYDESKHPRDSEGQWTNGPDALKSALDTASKLDSNVHTKSLVKRLDRLVTKTSENQMPLEMNADYRVVRALREFINTKLKPTLSATPKNKQLIKALDNAIVQAQAHMTPEGYSSRRFS